MNINTISPFEHAPSDSTKPVDEVIPFETYLSIKTIYDTLIEYTSNVSCPLWNDRNQTIDGHNETEVNKWILSFNRWITNTFIPFLRKNNIAFTEQLSFWDLKYFPEEIASSFSQFPTISSLGATFPKDLLHSSTFFSKAPVEHLKINHTAITRFPKAMFGNLHLKRVSFLNHAEETSLFGVSGFFEILKAHVERIGSNLPPIEQLNLPRGIILPPLPTKQRFSELKQMWSLGLKETGIFKEAEATFFYGLLFFSTKIPNIRCDDDVYQNIDNVVAIPGQLESKIFGKEKYFLKAIHETFLNYILRSEPTENNPYEIPDDWIYLHRGRPYQKRG